MDAVRPAHVHVDDVADEMWHGRDESRLTWRTLVGRPDSPTESLSGGVAGLAPGGGRLERHRPAPAEVYHVLACTGGVAVGDDRFEWRTGPSVFSPPAVGPSV